MKYLSNSGQDQTNSPNREQHFHQSIRVNIFHSCLDIDVGGEKDVDPEGAGEPPQWVGPCRVLGRASHVAPHVARVHGNVRVIRLKRKAASVLATGCGPPSPLPLREGRQVEIIRTRKVSPRPHWDRWAIQQNHIKYFSRPMWTPPINESAELTQVAL